MRIPSGDLVPARRRRYDGGYGRRRRRRTRRLAVVGVLLVLAGLVGFWLSRDEAPPLAAATCVEPTASPSPTRLLPGPGRVRVVLLNGTPRPGLASLVAQQLRTRGFLVLREDNAPAALAGPSQVTYAAGQLDAATVLGRHVLGARVSGTGPVPAGAVQVVLGGDFRRLATPAEVAAAARVPAPTASPEVRSCP